VKAVARTLGISRSNLTDRLAGKSKTRGRYRKAEDTEIEPEIRALVDRRPTYGYRRITALLNRQRQSENLPPINHKRVFRIMEKNGWLLRRHTGNRQGRVHDGKVIVMRSNLRWCSDALEFTCWNGEIVRVAFVIDAHDREIIAWRAVVGAGVSGDMIRDMMLEAVEKRFLSLRAPHPVEWLSDNGSIYTAKQTTAFATQLNLKPCFTPVASPQSNGMSEAFVKTLKRDYVHINPLPDAATVLASIQEWFEDYNENHPHSGLKMKSPREFIKAQTATAG